jgi:hypothetical protein
MKLKKIKEYLNLELDTSWTLKSGFFVTTWSLTRFHCHGCCIIIGGTIFLTFRLHFDFKIHKTKQKVQFWVFRPRACFDLFFRTENCRQFLRTIYHYMAKIVVKTTQNQTCATKTTNLVTLCGILVNKRYLK